MMQSLDAHIRDQLKFAREGAQNLAKRNGYVWTSWLKGKQGECTAAFDREGARWSLSFYWTPREELSELATRIENMDWCMRVAMKEFGALKLRALINQTSEMAVQ